MVSSKRLSLCFEGPSPSLHFGFVFGTRSRVVGVSLRVRSSAREVEQVESSVHLHVSALLARKGRGLAWICRYFLRLEKCRSPPLRVFGMSPSLIF